MLAFAGEFERFFRLLFAAWLLATAGRILAPVAAVGIRAKRGAFAMFRFFDHLLALLDLRGERGLRGGLRVCRGLLRSANLGRVLRGGQVCQLQIRGTNRHGRLFHPAASVLLYFLYFRREVPRRSRAGAADTSV